jgi:hypothetical protein
MLQREGKSIIQCGREVPGKEISAIREMVGLFPNLSRTELTATLCEYLDWFTASGEGFPFSSQFRVPIFIGKREGGRMRKDGLNLGANSVKLFLREP